MSNGQTAVPAGATAARRTTALEKAAHLLGVFFATFEAITIHSALSGHLAIGAVQALVVLGGAIAFVVWRIQAGDARRRVLARVALSVAAAAIVCSLVLAGKIAELAPLAIQATKASSLLYAEQGEHACAAELSKTQAGLSRTEDAKEGVASFVEKRDPVFKGR